MAKTIRYTLEEFNQISFDGFDFKLPEETLNIISNLALKVGSPSYVKTPVFQKRDNSLKTQSASATSNKDVSIFKKKRGNKSMEIINDDDWESLRTFQATKIEQKVGLDAKIDVIRSYLNKLTDKNYLDLRNNIVETVEQIVSDSSNHEELTRIGTNIFEIASTNRFYSKIYADLYSDLISKYEIMREIFQKSFGEFLETFNNIEYVEPSVDYDRFCKINKDNEKRKALSSFFINLMVNKIIEKEKIICLMKNLMEQVSKFITVENKKNEVDELTENIIILYKKELFSEEDLEDVEIDSLTISEFIEKIANSKAKDYLSLTNKSIFKFMDMIEM
jgi:hypothetical protein